jgi:hypothetical protein
MASTPVVAERRRSRQASAPSLELGETYTDHEAWLCKKTKRGKSFVISAWALATLMPL